MAKNYYLPSDDAGKADLLDQFTAKLPKYSATLEISAVWKYKAICRPHGEQVGTRRC